jgi:hypothetical protein
MVLATGGAQNSNASAILLRTTTPSISSASFAQQLAAALEQYLGQPGNGSNLEIDIQPSQSQNSGGSQFLVTVKSSTAAPAAALTAPPAGTQAPLAPAPATLTATAGGRASAAGSASQIPPAPPGFDNVPFGSSFSTVPALDAQLAAFNKENDILAKINPDCLSTVAAQLGDPMAGQGLPGTNLKWNDLTQDQQLAYQHAQLCGLPQGQSMDQFLAAYVGPAEWWNASYANPNMFGAPPAAGSVNMYNSPYIDMNA